MGPDVLHRPRCSQAKDRLPVAMLSLVNAWIYDDLLRERRASLRFLRFCRQDGHSFQEVLCLGRIGRAEVTLMMTANPHPLFRS